MRLGRKTMKPRNLLVFNDTATAEIYTLSLHDALPIYLPVAGAGTGGRCRQSAAHRLDGADAEPSDRPVLRALDRKSTRLNSSHSSISYAVFCLKKKEQLSERPYTRIHTVAHSQCAKRD